MNEKKVMIKNLLDNRIYLTGLKIKLLQIKSIHLISKLQTMILCQNLVTTNLTCYREIMQFKNTMI